MFKFKPITMGVTCFFLISFNTLSSSAFEFKYNGLNIEGSRVVVDPNKWLIEKSGSTVKYIEKTSAEETGQHEKGVPSNSNSNPENDSIFELVLHMRDGDIEAAGRYNKLDDHAFVFTKEGIVSCKYYKDKPAMNSCISISKERCESIKKFKGDDLVKCMELQNAVIQEETAAINKLKKMRELLSKDFPKFEKAPDVTLGKVDLIRISKVCSDYFDHNSDDKYNQKSSIKNEKTTSAAGKK